MAGVALYGASASGSAITAAARLYGVSAAGTGQPAAVALYGVVAVGVAGSAAAVRIIQVSAAAPGLSGQSPMIEVGPARIVEPGDMCGLVARGLDKDTGKYLKTGVWQQVAGPSVSLAQQVTTDGVSVATFIAPADKVVRTVTIRLTMTAAGGMTSTQDVDCTIPPRQEWSGSALGVGVSTSAFPMSFPATLA